MPESPPLPHERTGLLFFMIAQEFQELLKSHPDTAHDRLTQIIINRLEKILNDELLAFKKFENGLLKATYVTGSFLNSESFDFITKHMNKDEYPALDVARKQYMNSLDHLYRTVVNLKNKYAQEKDAKNAPITK